MQFKTINPTTEEVIAEYETMSSEEVLNITQSCNEAYFKWKKLSISERLEHFKKFAEILRNYTWTYSRLITLEMGKPIKESVAELEKCAWMVDVYVENAEAWLADEQVEADGKEHRVIFQPLGVILSIMPWNFPFWQSLRFAIPTLMAGNVSILKHSNTVPQCAMAIEKSFIEAGFPKNIFRTILADHGTVEGLISSDLIKGVSFTGSTEIGARIGEIAGKNLKKTVLELGGSDPFIILDDADLESTARNAVVSRIINTGQSCIAAKRFIVNEKIFNKFSKRFTELMSKLVIGDPMDEQTDVGPLVNLGGLNMVESQVNDAVAKGAKVLLGGSRLEQKGYFYPPTILVNLKADMQVITEEVFAPVAPIITVGNDDEAIKVANSTKFGLGGSVWTTDITRGEEIAKQIESGAVFVNHITKSDPRMPFGGIKKSGIGRELSKFGLFEFVNVKGMNIYRPKIETKIEVKKGK